MNNQVLTPTQRKAIRSDLYTTKSEQAADMTDPKISAFCDMCIGKEVLDLGCVDHDENNWKSKYWLHKALKSVAKKIVGLDYYEAGVVQLQDRGFDVIQADAQDFSIGHEFEVVTAGDLIEHIPNLDGFMRSVNKALTTNGQLVITTPNPWCWKYALYHLFRGKLEPMNPEHVSWFCLQTLEQLGRRYGFAVMSHKYLSRRRYERFAPLPTRIKHTTILVVFEKIAPV